MSAAPDHGSVPPPPAAPIQGAAMPTPAARKIIIGSVIGVISIVAGASIVGVMTYGIGHFRRLDIHETPYVKQMRVDITKADFWDKRMVPALAEMEKRIAEQTKLIVRDAVNSQTYPFTPELRAKLDSNTIAIKAIQMQLQQIRHTNAPGD